MATIAADQPSIDAIVYTPIDAVFSMPQSPTTPHGSGYHDVEVEAPIKLKGRKRLLHSLQRMSSSPSLARFGRSQSGGYRTGGKASMSCVSLASSGYTGGLHYASSYNSDFSAQFSTAPTSLTTTPGASTPRYDPIGRPRARTLGKDTPTSVGLPSDVVLSSRMGQACGIEEVEEDYFSPRPALSRQTLLRRRKDFNFWADLPLEVRMQIFAYLDPRQIVRCSSVSKAWHRMCFDGQLWANTDTSGYYRDISAESLIKIIASAGPFVRDLNLRGCVQLRERWAAQGLSDACKNLQNFSLEGCIIDRGSLHSFLLRNNRLVHINLSGLANADNASMRIIGQHCPKIEHLNVTWCQKIDTKGLHHVIEGCQNLKDLRAGETKGWDDTELMLQLFRRNTLERLLLTNCETLSDEALEILVHGTEPDYDYLSDRVRVPPRKLKHLDLTRCRGLSDTGISKLAHNLPDLEGLQLSKNTALTDDSLRLLLPTLHRLTHLDLEELDALTNATLECLATAACAKTLQHLSISYCENLGDAGMIPVFKSCTRLSSVDMDNTRVSDLSLIEAADNMRLRNNLCGRWLAAHERPSVGLKLIAYDCANVTWTGVREILCRNAKPMQQAKPAAALGPLYPPEIIALKAFYNWQPTVEEHTKRLLRGDFVAATRLERKWAEWMLLNEEVGAGGGRRRRRRAREAQLLHVEEEEEGSAGGMGGVGVVRRRRARSGPVGTGCVVM